jgi:hypothetical protein
MSDADHVTRAKEKGISDALLARIRVVYRPSEIDWLLGPNGPPLSGVERDLDVRERTMNGPFRVREMNGRDGEAFSELWAHSPEKIGDWSVIVERSPNSLAQFLLHEDCSITVLEERGSLYACTAWSNRNVMLQGKTVPIHVAHSLRVHESRRGERLADLVRRYPRRATSSRPTIAQFMYVRTGNDGVLGFLGKVANEAFGKIGSAGVTTEVTHFSPRPYSGSARGIRKVRSDDLVACATLINRTHGAFDLFAPYSAENLASRLDQGFPGELPSYYPHVYGWQDFHLLEENGAIVACAGLWDRGRDMRETWRKAEETRTIAVTNLLDFGYDKGAEDAMALLIEYLLGETERLSRTSLVAPLDRLPALASACARFDPRGERRTFEWTPFVPEAPRTVPEPYTDLRFR